MDSAIADANQVLTSEHAGPRDPPPASAPKLVEKLAASGQLNAGFLMRVLSQGQTDLFDLAFARVLGIELEKFRSFSTCGVPAPWRWPAAPVASTALVFHHRYSISHARPATPQPR